MYLIYCLLLWLCLGRLVNGDNVANQAGSDVKDTQNKNEISTVPPEQFNPPNNTAQPGQPNQTNDPKKGPSSQCAPNEVFIVNKGCVDREPYLERLLVNTWDDGTMDAAKNKAGLKQTVECKTGEIRTAFGCAPDKGNIQTLQWKRPTILHGQLYGNQVFKGNDALPRIDRFPGNSNAAKNRSPTNYKSQGRRRNLDNDENLTSGHVVGHNRPRSYIFMPGRKLQSQRKCRPYEVLARNNRCIRKRGKTGFYKHTDHQYEIQQRHQHEAFKPTDNI